MTPQGASGHDFPVVAVFLQGFYGIGRVAIFFEAADAGFVYEHIQCAVRGIADEHHRDDFADCGIVGGHAFGV